MPKFMILFIIVFIAGFFVGYVVIQQNEKVAPGKVIKNTSSGITSTGAHTIQYSAPQDISSIKSNTDSINFLNNASFPEALSFLALKKKDKILWNTYWKIIYEKNQNVLTDTFLKTTENAYNSILNKKMTIGTSADVFLDGSIFFSNATIAEKINACDIYHKDAGALQKERTINCKNMSYFYEALTTKDCEPIIDYIDEKNIKQYCKEISFIR